MSILFVVCVNKALRNICMYYTVGTSSVNSVSYLNLSRTLKETSNNSYGN